MGPERPDKPTIAYAITRAATLRRWRYQNDDRYRHFTEAAMLEQVCGVPDTPRDEGDGWWLVGKVMDVIENARRYAEGTAVRLDVRSARDLPAIKKLVALKLEN